MGENMFGGFREVGREVFLEELLFKQRLTCKNKPSL